MPDFIFAGNKHIREAIGAAASRGSFSHAYIISGPEGSGKKTIALYMAAAILCESAQLRPCGVCRHCRKVAAGIHPDAVLIDNEGREFVVGQSRELRTGVFTRPNEAEYKVYIIANAQDMNRYAQNALLTILEEPPAYAVFILLTEGGMLDTVRSRCTELKTAPVAADEAMAYLKARFHDANTDMLYAAVNTGGTLGACIKALEVGVSGDVGADFIKALAARDELELFKASTAAGRLGREEFKMFLEQLLPALHTLLLSNLEISSGARDNGALSEYTGLTNHEILHTIEEVQKTRKYCDFNIGPANLAGALAASLFL